MSRPSVRARTQRNSLDSSDEEPVEDKYNVLQDLPSVSFSDHRRNDDDSGIYNVDSSKATSTSICSVGSNTSDRDYEYDSAGDERYGIVDYMPLSHSKSSSTRNEQVSSPRGEYPLDFDEAFDVDSEKTSQVDIDSPRSDFSCDKSDSDIFRDGHRDIELQSFQSFHRVEAPASNDFETDDESEEDTKQSIHKKLYRDHPRKSNNYYKSNQNFEDYYTSSTGYGEEMTFNSLKETSVRGVDESVRFSSLNSPSYGTTSRSEGTHVQKSVYSRHGNAGLSYDPPFGQREDQFQKVAQSIGGLISKSNSHGDISNLPEARHLQESMGMDGHKMSKKHKKKRGTGKNSIFLLLHFHSINLVIL